MIRTFCGGIAASLTIAASASAGSLVLEDRLVMQDHPDGNAANPLYSLRVDGLFGSFADSNGNSFNTTSFSSQQGGAQVFIDILRDSSNDSVQIHIHGQLYGGLDVRRGNGTDRLPSDGLGWAAESTNPADAGFYTGLWDVDFSYALNVQTVAEGFVVNGPDNFTNAGSLQRQGMTRGVSDRFDLVDNDNNRFLLLADGHRLAGDNSSMVGRGWLTPNSNGNNASGLTQDWLFRGERLVPLPTPAAFASLTLAGYLGIRRRR